MSNVMTAEMFETDVLDPRDDPQPGMVIYGIGGGCLRRIVARADQQIGYVIGAGIGSVTWCSLLSWRIWCDATPLQD